MVFDLLSSRGCFVDRSMNLQFIPFNQAVRLAATRLLFALLLVLSVAAVGADTPPVRHVGDINNDGDVSVVDLTRLRMHIRGLQALQPRELAYADVSGDGVVNEDDSRELVRLILQDREAVSLALTEVRETSPTDGESSVSSNRRTGIIVRFSLPLDPQRVQLTQDDFFATVNGRKLNTRAELSSDGRKASLFVTDKIPGSARVDVTLKSERLVDLLGRKVDGDADGVEGGDFKFYYVTEAVVAVPNTVIKGTVLASEKRDGQDVPLKGVTVRVAGAEMQTVTDENGQFSLNCPAGRFFAEVDGRTSPLSKFPEEAYYPFVVKAWEAVAGSNDNLAAGTGKIYLPLVPKGALKEVSATVETKVGMTPELVGSNPALAEVGLTVPPGALRKEDGTIGGKVGMAPVAPDRLPEPLAPDLNFPLVITIQTDGASNFDQPVAVRFPNLPDPVTGERLKAGEKTGLWSFNHDTGSWELQGPATVTDDGLYVVTDPGVGVRQPGWHGVLPGSQGIGPKWMPADEKMGGVAKKAVRDVLKKVGEGSLAVRDAFMLMGRMRDRSENLREVRGLVEEVRGLVGEYEFSGSLPYWWGLPWISLKIAKLQKAYEEQLTTGSLLDTLNRLDPLLEKVRVQVAGLSGFNGQVNANSPEYGWRADQFVQSNQSLAFMLPEVQRYVASVRKGTTLFSRTAFRDVGRVLFPGFNAPEPTLAQQMAALKKFVADMEGFASVVAPDHERYFWDLERQVSDYLARAGTLLTSVTAKAPTYGYVLIEALGDPQRIRSNASGDYRMVLPPNREFSLTYVDPRTQQIGAYVGISNWNGSITELYGPVLAELPAGLKDTDGDALADVIEDVVGTDIAKQDTDGDGISDQKELLRGKNPLSGMAVGTGVVFSVSTSEPGFESTDIAAAGDVLLVSEQASEGSSSSYRGGLLVYGIEDKLEPLRQSWIGLNAPVKRVTYGDGGYAILSLGTDGVGIVDIRDPKAPVVQNIFQPEGGGSVDVAILVGDVLVLGVSGDASGADVGRLVLMRLDTGETIASRVAGSVVNDLVARGTMVYALAKAVQTSEYWWWYWGVTSAVHVGDVSLGKDVAFSATSVKQWEYSKSGGRLALSSDRLFVVHESGMISLVLGEGVSVKNEGEVFKPDSGFQLGWRQVLFDASEGEKGMRTFVAAVGSSAITNPDADGDVHVFEFGPAGNFGGATDSWWMYWLKSSTPMARFVTRFDSRADRPSQANLASGNVFAMATAGGVIYATDRERGFHVVNYRQYDAKGVAPSVSLVSNAVVNGSSAVRRVASGSLLSLRANVKDDVSVAAVEWYVDGVRVSVTGGHPWSYTMRVPSLESGEVLKRYRVVAKAFDTGGNQASTEETAIDVVPEVIPPVLVQKSPQGNLREVDELRLVFSEAMDPQTLGNALSLVTVAESGKQTPVSLPVGSMSQDGATYAVKFTEKLPEGVYRATLKRSVADRFGNQLGKDEVWTFSVAAVNRWVGKSPGLWSDPENWSSKVVPLAGDRVLFPAAGAPHVVVGGRTTFMPDQARSSSDEGGASASNLTAGAKNFERTVTKGVEDLFGWYGFKSPLPKGTVRVGMKVSGARIPEGVTVVETGVTIDSSDLSEQQHVTNLTLSSPLTESASGQLPWVLSTSVEVQEVIVEGATTLVDVDLKAGKPIALKAQLAFSAQSSLSVPAFTVEGDGRLAVVSGTRTSVVAQDSVEQLVSGSDATELGRLVILEPLSLSSDLEISSAGIAPLEFRSVSLPVGASEFEVTTTVGVSVGMPVTGNGVAAGTTVTSVTDRSITLSQGVIGEISDGVIFVGSRQPTYIELKGGISLNGNDLVLSGGYAGGVRFAPAPSRAEFEITGPGSIRFVWESDLVQHPLAQWEKLLMSVSVPELTIPAGVRWGIEGKGRVRVLGKLFKNSGAIDVGELGWLQVRNYLRDGQSEERIGTGGKLEQVPNVEFEVQKFATSNEATFRVKDDGTLWAWGYNGDGRLGLGDPSSAGSEVREPTRVGQEDGWEQIATSNWGTVFATKKDGSLWAWGNNGDGRLGLGGIGLNTAVTSPTRIGNEFGWSNVVSTDGLTFAVRDDGSLWAWGYNGGGGLGVGELAGVQYVTTPTRVGLDTGWVRVVSSQEQTFAIKEDGSLWAWGSNWGGRLGLGDIGVDTIVGEPVRVGVEEGWESVVSNGSQTFAVKDDGSLWAWGYNWDGELGLGDPSMHGVARSPVRIGVETDWRKIVTGAGRAFGIREGGSLWAWGYNGQGQLGLGGSGYGSTVRLPTRVGDQGGWQQIVSSGYGTFGVKDDGTLWAWGYNYDGRLGLGEQSINQHVTEPTSIGASHEWRTLFSGSSSEDWWASRTFASRRDGSLWAWGYNGDGRLGLANVTEGVVREPARVMVDFPEITVQPAGSGLLAPGGSVVVSLGAVGAPPLSFQWYRGTVAVDGANGSSYEATAPGSYRVVVSNSRGSATSSWVEVLPADSDGDGVLDEVELRDGTNPNNPESFHPLSRGLLAEYAFSGDAKDRSGYGYDGVMQGSPSFAADRMGVAAGSLLFSENQQNQRVVSESDYRARVSGSFTVSFWARPQGEEPLEGESAGGTSYSHRYLISPVHGGENAGIGIGLGANGISVVEQGHQHLPVVLSHAGSFGEWTHFAVVVAGDGAPQLFVNGEFVKSGVNSGRLKLMELMGTAWVDNEGVVSGEGLGGGGYGSYSGGLDDLRLYGRALSDAEVLSLYERQKGVPEMVDVSGGALPEGSELVGQRASDFRIGRREVTWGEWKEARAWGVLHGYDLAEVGQGSGDWHPVHHVSWYDVVKWCNALSERDGLTPVYWVAGQVFREGQPEAALIDVSNSASGYRLPTEVEWEWAARGGTASRGYTYSGSNTIEEVGWCIWNSGGAPVNLWEGKGTWPVGLKAANELGIFDMSGNVLEYVWDGSTGLEVVVRGGCFDADADLAQPSNRAVALARDYRGFNSRGFRVAQSAPQVTVKGGVLPAIAFLDEQAVGDFQMSRFEVTWGEWKQIHDWAVLNGYEFSGVGLGSGNSHPVRGLSWFDIVKWCNAFSEYQGLEPVYRLFDAVYRQGQPSDSEDISSVTEADGFRLPTSAEWLWAARGGVYTNDFAYSGGNDVASVGWYAGNSTGSAVDLGGGLGTWPVGRKAANELGIHDLSGNVWEWSWERRLLGGGWTDDADVLLLQDGGFVGYPDDAGADYGFRWVRNIPRVSMPLVRVQGGTLPEGSELAGQVVGDFSMGRTEVTWGEWKAVRDWAATQGYDLAGVGGTYPENGADNLPVVNVSWYDVVKWCNARSEKEGKTAVYQANGGVYRSGEFGYDGSSAVTMTVGANGYRLPLEKEWEWAARGGVSSKGYTYSGGNVVGEVAWLDENSGGVTKAVGGKKANELGLSDMSGNVWEWVWDVNDGTSGRRVRGGSWYDADAPRAEVSHRRDDIYYPDFRLNDYGFRVAFSSGQ